MTLKTLLLKSTQIKCGSVFPIYVPPTHPVPYTSMQTLFFPYFQCIATEIAFYFLIYDRGSTKKHKQNPKRPIKHKGSIQAWLCMLRKIDAMMSS